jgi:hypothetical protein
MADFRDRAEALAPLGGWLRDDASKAWLRAQGGAVSDTLALWKAGVKQRYASTCGEDALPLLGDSRQISQAPGETTASHRARLRRAFEIHTDRTTKMAYKHIFEALGFDPAQVTVWSDWEDSLLPATPGDDPWWSRVTVVVDARTGPWSAPVWTDDAVWTETEVWGIEGATQAQIQWLRQQIRKTKWAGAYPLAVVFIFGGDVWGLETVWSDSAVWSEDPASVAVLPLGHVWGFNEAVYGAPPDLWNDSEVWKDAFTFDD